MLVFLCFYTHLSASAHPVGADVALEDEACATRIIPAEKWHSSTAENWDFNASATDAHGEVVVFGSEHGHQPGSKSYANIIEEFGEIRPTAVLFEGHECRSCQTANILESEALDGEAGLLQSLAKSFGVPAASLEPQERILLDSLSSDFDRRLVVFFLVERFSAIQSERNELPDLEVDQKSSEYLSHVVSVAGLAPSTRIDDLRVWVSKAFSVELPERIPLSWFSPLASSAKAARGEQLMHAVNARENAIRNRSMFTKIVVQAARYQRVFVVVGRNHVPLLRPALRCALWSRRSAHPAGKVSIMNAF